MEQAKDIILNGVKFPIAYNGYKISRKKIWSTNSKRTNSGNMVGTILAIKTMIEIKLLPLTPMQAQTIDNIVSDINNPFQTATIVFLDGNQKDITVYISDVSYPWPKGGKNGKITGVTLSLLER